MGSELKDSATGQTIWGFGQLGWYAKAWTRPGGLESLAITPGEREGKADRVRATGLLRFPAFAPILRGAEPYTELLRGISEVVAHPDAVLEFPYDWRLPVTHNAGLLADAAHRHLLKWRAHPALADFRRARGIEQSARIVLVAHSMGGLVARAMSAIPGAAEQVRATVTLGTPFHGAVKTTVVLGSGRGAPLPHRRLRDVAATMPGIYDLLPGYRCVDIGGDVMRLTPSDLAGVGGDDELAQAALDSQRLAGRTVLPGHRAVIGTEQPTFGSLLLRDGVVEARHDGFRAHSDGELMRDANGVLVRVNLGGDGTVARDAATLDGAARSWLPQQHGALARSETAVKFVRAVLTEHDEALGPPLGAGELGIDPPDVVEPGRRWPLVVSGAERPSDAMCALFDAETNALLARPRLEWQDGRIVARIVLPAPGVYRVQVTGGGGEPVSQLVLAADPSDGAGD